MALKIRLRRMGRKDAPTYRIVVAESSMPRDGRFVESLGHYNPRTEPVTLVVNRDKALQWLAKGAVPTDTTRSLLKRAGVFSPAPPESLVATTVGAVKGAAGKVAAAAKDARETVVEAAKEARETVAEVAHDAREGVGRIVEAVKDAAEDVRERLAGGEEEAAAEPQAAEAGDAAPAESEEPKA